MTRHHPRAIARAASAVLLIGATSTVSAGSVVSSRPNDVDVPFQVEEARERDLFNHHADLSSAISSTNVNQLQLAWSVPTDEEVSHTPLIDGNRIYFADWGANVYAVDAQNRQIIWKTRVQDSVMEKWPWYGIAGTGAQSDTLLFEASVEGREHRR
jgi:outer membrane protein assembly factor BamB